jgi:hypothetical protein
MAAADLLYDAYGEFERLSLHGYAAAASHVSGLLRKDREGERQMECAATFMQTENVRNPAAFIQMLLPGNWHL